MKQIGMFDESSRLSKLSKLGDTLERLNRIIDWEMFRPIIAQVRTKEHKGAGGRPPYDDILMFKILVLQRLYNLSDDQTEYQINDRMSFMRFLGLTISDTIPDAKTIWLFREQLTQAKIIKGSSNFIGGNDTILIDLSSWDKESISEKISKLYNPYRNLYLDKCYGESKTPLGEWMYFPTDEED